MCHPHPLIYPTGAPLPSPAPPPTPRLLFFQRRPTRELGGVADRDSGERSSHAQRRDCSDGRVAAEEAGDAGATTRCEVERRRSGAGAPFQ
jgi:hypothetical protein